jgi:predicted nicotinamide N-methyase
MMPEPCSVEAFIRDNLPVVAVPGLPGMRLHKAAPDSGLGRLAAADPTGFGSPYWAYHWAGGLALARYVFDHSESVAGRNVVDLGAGGGLVAIAAARAGAARVTAAETDPYAVAALRCNAALNEVEVAIVADDLTRGSAPAADVMLVGDLFYAPDLAARVGGFLDRCRAQGVQVLVGDPWRSFLPIARLHEIARYPVVETGRGPGKLAGVFEWIAAEP